MKDAIILWSAVAGIGVAVLALIDFLFNRWSYLKRLGTWVNKQALRFKIDQTTIVLKVPAPIPISTIPTSSPGAVAAETTEGVTKHLVKHIMSGTRQNLMAYEITRQGFPGTQFYVERVVPKQGPNSYLTSDRDKANAKWREWYYEWKKQPGGFGGSFGNGLDGISPW
jgi:hypothetical protein